MQTPLRRWISRVLVGVSAVAASILVPSSIITLDSLIKRDGHATFMFALAVAEALALMGAGWITFLGARMFARRAPRPLDEGTVIGTVSAVGVAAAAIWVGDVDGWTFAAGALLPLLGYLGGRSARRAEQLRAAEDAPASLPPHPISRSPRGTRPKSSSGKGRWDLCQATGGRRHIRVRSATSVPAPVRKSAPQLLDPPATLLDCALIGSQGGFPEPVAP